ncbi:MAG: ATP-binding cassette domain-containing protein [Rhodobacteraceae bacterium]|nr:ATP-binding cassette domain-containing protein [Paracoccaceae bacterium]
MTKEQKDIPAISCRDVSVSFGEISALSDISVDLPLGGIHAVVGQNGAGKTTLARVITGIVKPDSGSLLINGKKIILGSVASSRSSGIELVHQSFALPPSFTVAEALEYSTGGGVGFFKKRDLNQRWRQHLESLEMDIDPRHHIQDLPIEHQQAVEIARALSSRASILILDEPTAVLSPSGIVGLFKRLRRLRDAGVTIVLVLHKIREIWEVADTITVLRKGKLIDGPMELDNTEPESLTPMIMGAKNLKVSFGRISDKNTENKLLDQNAVSTRPKVKQNALEIEGVSTETTAQEVSLENMSIKVDQDEIVGIAGVEGNGQLTLLRVLAGLSNISKGKIKICGQEATHLNLSKRRLLGLRIIPFDRNREGLSLTSTLWENWVASELAVAPLLRWINPMKIKERCKISMSDWGVAYNAPEQKAAYLSGGNCQKLILSRELNDEAGMIVAAQPTRGLDIGATNFVWATLESARSRGCGVLLISSDLDELFEISDRILVMLSGRIVCELNPPYDMEITGRAMVGGSG